MLRVSLLNSGSSGNSCLFDNGTTVMAIDMGLKTTKLWKERAAARGYSISDIDYTLITHAHCDHVNTPLNTFIKLCGNESVFTTKKVANDISRKSKLSNFKLDKISEIDINKEYEIGTFVITARKMSHFGLGKSRINECVGYHIYDKVNKKNIFYATDTSSLQNVVVPEGGFDLLMLESNHYAKLVQDVYDMSNKTAEDIAKYTRTKDHMSIEDLNAWLFENQHNAEFVPLHESPRNLLEKQRRLKDAQFYKTYWKEIPEKGEKNE